MNEHRLLRRAVAKYLHATAKPPEKMLFQLRGVAMHDLYHAGQIQLLKRLHAARAMGLRACEGA